LPDSKSHQGDQADRLYKAAALLGPPFRGKSPDRLPRNTIETIFFGDEIKSGPRIGRVSGLSSPPVPISASAAQKAACGGDARRLCSQSMANSSAAQRLHAELSKQGQYTLPLGNGGGRGQKEESLTPIPTVPPPTAPPSASDKRPWLAARVFVWPVSSPAARGRRQGLNEAGGTDTHQHTGVVGHSSG
jgi:hypothetical protein